jgi:MSHA pilin protein MshA
VKRSYAKAKGFTLIELIVVIVILGIMAAIAAPKFVNLQSDARSSVMKGLEGSLRSGATLVYSRALIDGIEANDEACAAPLVCQVNVAGGTVATKFGYPRVVAIVASPGPVTGGIMDALDLEGDIVTESTAAAVTFTLGKASCTVVYTEAGSAGAAASIVNNATTANC